MRTVIKSREDIQWLREKLPTNAPKFTIAILHGNEDWPTLVECYSHNAHDCIPTLYKPNAQGELLLAE